MQRTTALRASSAMDGSRGRGSPKKRDREQPANQDDSPNVHALVERFVFAANQIIVRRNPRTRDGCQRAEDESEDPVAKQFS